MVTSHYWVVQETEIYQWKVTFFLEIDSLHK